MKHKKLPILIAVPSVVSTCIVIAADDGLLSVSWASPGSPDSLVTNDDMVKATIGATNKDT